MRALTAHKKPKRRTQKARRNVTPEKKFNATRLLTFAGLAVAVAGERVERVERDGRRRRGAICQTVQRPRAAAATFVNQSNSQQRANHRTNHKLPTTQTSNQSLKPATIQTLFSERTPTRVAHHCRAIICQTIFKRSNKERTNERTNF